MSNQFDPSKLNIDFNSLDDNNSNPLNKGKKPDETNKVNTNSSIFDNYTSILKPEENSKENDPLIPISKPEENKDDFINEQISSNDKVLFDINIKTVDDIINILSKKEYDYVVFEPYWDYIKIVFKKDSQDIDIKYIKYLVYTNLVINLKKICKLDITNSKIEQKWTWNYNFWENYIDVLLKIVPTDIAESVFLKIKKTDRKIKSNNEKKWISFTKALVLLLTLLLVILIVWWTFISFIIFTAKSWKDLEIITKFFGISWSDIKYFLQNTVNIIFWILISIGTMIWIIVLFKAILTKKIYKKKKIINIILSILIWIILFSTWLVWMNVYAKIESWTPWFFDVSAKLIKVFDNNLYLNNNFSDKNSEINVESWNRIIWPIDLRFDLTTLYNTQLRSNFKIHEYIWDFWDWKWPHKTTQKEYIQSFNETKKYDIKLLVEWIETRTNDVITKEITIDPIYISNIIDVTFVDVGQERKYTFNAENTWLIWNFEWYLPNESIDTPKHIGQIFTLWIEWWKENIVQLKIVDPKSSNKDSTINKFFVIKWPEFSVDAKVDYKQNYENDLEYSFSIKEVSQTHSFWDIEFVEWIFVEDDKNEKRKIINMKNIQQYSKINYIFKDHWYKTIRIILSNNKYTYELPQIELNINRQLKIDNNLLIKLNKNDFKDFIFDAETQTYNINNIWIPANFSFDWRFIKSNNPNYNLKSIKWSNLDKIETNKIFNIDFDIVWDYEIWVEYTFEHKNNKEDIVNIKQNIKIYTIQKDIDLNLEITPKDEYAPTTVRFDWSLSKIKDDVIVNYDFDFWDWTTESTSQSIVWEHIYKLPWKYDIKMTITTESWKKYDLNKILILKQKWNSAKITTSLKKAPINQKINFNSLESNWYIKSYLWDFWDWNKSFEANPQHSYENPWIYEVVLTLVFDNNNQEKDTVSIEITQ